MLYLHSHPRSLFWITTFDDNSWKCDTFWTSWMKCLLVGWVRVEVYRLPGLGFWTRYGHGVKYAQCQIEGCHGKCPMLIYDNTIHVKYQGAVYFGRVWFALLFHWINPPIAMMKFLHWRFGAYGRVMYWWGWIILILGNERFSSTKRCVFDNWVDSLSYKNSRWSIFGKPMYNMWLESFFQWLKSQPFGDFLEDSIPTTDVFDIGKIVTMVLGTVCGPFHDGSKSPKWHFVFH